MAAVTPRLSTEATHEQRMALMEAGQDVARAAVRQREVVLEAIRDGVSIREVAALANLSTNTVQRWKAEASS
jgi:DNA-directed RNA polymerase specialized sigma24 family protein